MKKILLLFAFACLIPVGCGPDELIVDVVEIPQNNDDPQNDDDNPPPPGEVYLTIDDILWNSSEGFLRLDGNEAFFPEEINPTHVGVRLFENGRELEPTGYWLFEQKNGSTTLWHRPPQIELVPNSINTGPLQIQLYAKTATSNGFELYKQITKDINWGRPYLIYAIDSIAKETFIEAPRIEWKD